MPTSGVKARLQKKLAQRRELQSVVSAMKVIEKRDACGNLRLCTVDHKGIEKPVLGDITAENLQKALDMYAGSCHELRQKHTEEETVAILERERRTARQNMRKVLPELEENFDEDMVISMHCAYMLATDPVAHTMSREQYFRTVLHEDPDDKIHNRILHCGRTAKHRPCMTCKEMTRKRCDRCMKVPFCSMPCLAKGWVQWHQKHCVAIDK